VVEVFEVFGLFAGQHEGFGGESVVERILAHAGFALGGAGGTGSLQAERELYDKIRRTIDGIVATLSDMNALTPKRHQGSEFGELIDTVEARLRE
jgi:hypothetical protein